MWCHQMMLTYSLHYQLHNWYMMMHQLMNIYQLHMEYMLLRLFDHQRHCIYLLHNFDTPFVNLVNIYQMHMEYMYSHLLMLTYLLPNQDYNPSNYLNPLERISQHHNTYR